MNGRKLYTMPKTKAPSPNGTFRKSNNATVANVRIRILTHIGKINNTTIVREVLNRAWLNIQAAGYPSNKQKIVVIKAIPTEYTKVFIASGCTMNLRKLVKVNIPSSVVNA